MYNTKLVRNTQQDFNNKILLVKVFWNDFHVLKILFKNTIPGMNQVSGMVEFRKYTKHNAEVQIQLIMTDKFVFAKAVSS